jgi:hypothetical protein
LKLRFRPSLEHLEERVVPAVHDLTTHLNYATIQAAVTAANPGDTILADAGIYAEKVTIGKSLILEGANHGVNGNSSARSAESIATGVGNGGDTPFYITANDVTIDGFTVQGATNVNVFGVGILEGTGTSGSHILNNIIQNNIVGLMPSNGSSIDTGLIQNNLFQNNNAPGPAHGNAIYRDDSTASSLIYVTIDGNTFTNNSNAAVSLVPSTGGAHANDHITISNNVMIGNGEGLNLSYVTNSMVYRNTITGSTHSQIDLRGGVNGLIVQENFITNGSTNGILLENTAGSPNQNVTIYDNSIAGNSTAGLMIAANGYAGMLDARYNWWGNGTGPSIASNPYGTGDRINDPLNQVNYSPWLATGVDTQSSTPGFQGDLSNISQTVLIYAEFPGSGVYRYTDTGGWQNLTPGNPNVATVLASDSFGNLYAEFHGYGILQYNNSTGWTSLNTADATLMTLDAAGNLYAEFPGYGLMKYSGGTWQNLTPGNSNVATALVSDSFGNLYAEFHGYGILQYNNSTGWTSLNTADASLMTLDAAGNLYAEFPGYGVMKYSGGTWTNLTPGNSNVATALAVSASGNLYAEFSGYGVLQYNSSTGWTPLNTADASAMAADPSGDLFANFPGYGIMEYAGGAGWRSLISSNLSVLAVPHF